MSSLFAADIIMDFVRSIHAEINGALVLLLIASIVYAAYKGVTQKRLFTVTDKEREIIAQSRRSGYYLDVHIEPPPPTSIS
jgi:Ni,Fe-hydrogenase I cytochrome b subunit